MTLQELFDEIANSILITGTPNNIDAAKMRAAIERLGNFLNPGTGDAAFVSFIRHLVDSEQNLQAFESYFTTTRKSVAGEFALFYDPTFFGGLVFARQLGSEEAPVPATSGSFSLSTAPFDGSAKSQAIDISGLSDGTEYVIKYHRADGDVTNPKVIYNGEELTVASVDFAAGVVAFPFIKVSGQDSITLEYDAYANGTDTTLNYTLRPLKPTTDMYVGQYIYHIEENTDVNDFIFSLIIPIGQGGPGGGDLSQSDINTYAKLAAIVVGLQAEFDSTEASSNSYTDAQLAGVVADILAIQTLLQSDDTTLDELQEVVDYIKQNRNDLSSLGIANVSGLQAELDSRLKRVVDEDSYSIRPDVDSARVFNIGELSSRFSRIDLNASVAFIARLGNSDINMENDFVRLSNVINGFKTIRVDDTGIIVRDDAFSRGLQGHADYSSNVQLLDYVQRAYLENVAILKSFNGLQSLNENLLIRRTVGANYGQLQITDQSVYPVWNGDSGVLMNASGLSFIVNGNVRITLDAVTGDLTFFNPLGEPTNINMGDNGQIKNIIDPTDDQDATSKLWTETFVAQQLAGVSGDPLGFYDFDASSGNLPTTGSGTSNAIRLGDRYEITVAGTLNDGSETATVEVGDILIARSASPTTLAGFAIAQSNSEIASQVEAEAATDSVKRMTPLRSRQQFRSLISDALLDILQGTDQSFTTALRDSLNNADTRPASTEIDLNSSSVINCSLGRRLYDTLTANRTITAINSLTEPTILDFSGPHTVDFDAALKSDPLNEFYGNRILQEAPYIIITPKQDGGIIVTYLNSDNSSDTSRKTSSHVLELADEGNLVDMNVSSANTVTVPPNSSVPFPLDSEIALSQYGAGQTSIVAGSGVTIRSADGALNLRTRYSGATLKKIGTDEWYLFGDIEV
ncbi:MAG: hypothetical protein AAGF85_00595 [Bacteroidota bacterium]